MNQAQRPGGSAAQGFRGKSFASTATSRNTGEVAAARTFEELLAEGAAEPVEGWDFSWFAGRATEERPSWGYSRLLAERMAGATAALDIQTGGGEVLAQIPHPPPTLAATESWPPNIAVARRNLGPLGASVTEVDDLADLPFPAESFDLVVSRHLTDVLWEEIARVLRPGGTYLSQQVGAGTNRELYEFMMGPQPANNDRSPQLAAAAAEAAGLVVIDLREQALRVEFYDIAAVVYFLRKVLWTVPGFTVDGYRDQLARLHDRILREGPFVAHSQRFLIEARKPLARGGDEVTRELMTGRQTAPDRASAPGAGHRGSWLVSRKASCR